MTMILTALLIAAVCLCFAFAWDRKQLTDRIGNLQKQIDYLLKMIESDKEDIE